MWPFCKAKEQKPCWKHHLLIFLAGAEAFHTLSHILLAYSGTLPVQIFGYDWGANANFWAIIINALITVGLLYWAKREHHSH